MAGPASALPAAAPLDAVMPPGMAGARRPSSGGAAGGDRIHETARQFEAMFMTEMMRQARPQNHAKGAFAPGEAEKSWQMFMDQALGDAAAAAPDGGLGRQIENSLRAAAHHSDPPAASHQPDPRAVVRQYEAGGAATAPAPKGFAK